MKYFYSHLTKTLIAIALLFTLLSAHSQSFEDFIPKQKLKDGTITMPDYKNAFTAYCNAFNADADGYYISNGVKTRLPRFKQFKRWEWFWEQRVDAMTGEFPKTSIADLYEKYLKENSDVTDSEYGDWMSKGPYQSLGGSAGIGRINCIAFHPTNQDVFWVGSPSGGLWRTDDGGNSWINLNDNEDVLGVSDIAIPSNYETSGTIYIATGDRDHGSIWSLGGTHYENNSIGVLKSTDFGSSWTELTLCFYVSQAATTNRLLMDPQNNNILYAATSDGLYKTTDAGNNWNKLTDNEFIDMEFKPGNSQVVYASTKYYGQIWLSENAGINWDKKKDVYYGVRTELAVSPANAEVVYAVMSNTSNGLKGVYKSINGGKDYDLVYDPAENGNHNLLHGDCDPETKAGGQGEYDLTIAVDPLNADILYVGGINTWKSVNSGSLFEMINRWSSDCAASVQIVHADKHCLAFQNNTTLFECNDGGIYKTTNGGTTWQDLTNGMVISQIYRIGVSQNESGTIICGLQDNGIKGFRQKNWEDIDGGDGMDCAIDYLDCFYQYATKHNGAFGRIDLHNNTKIITDITPKKNDNTYYKGAWVSPVAMDPLNPQTIYIGLNDTLWKSTNRGDNWMHISFEELFPSPDTIHSISIAPGDTNIIYVASFNKIFKTTNGGTSWTDISEGLPTTNKITNLEVSHTNPNYVWASFGGYGEDNIWFSAGEGTWINISAGLPQLPIMSVVENKLSETLELYAGTDRGVYCRTNGQWVPFMQSFPNVVVTELEIFYDDENPANSRLYAGTYGRGLWVSPLLGTEYTLSILSPEASAPAYINFNNPAASAIPVQIKIRDNNSKPITGLSIEQFIVRIGGENAVINGITYDQLSKRYSLNVVPPTLTEPGNYNLAVELTINDMTISEFNVGSVIYIESEFNLAIINPSAENPALVDYQSPSEHRFKIKAEVESNDGTFVNWLLQSNFEVTVGSAVATIYSLNVGSNFYDIEIIPPAQVNPEYYYDVQVAVKVNDVIVDQKKQAACVYYTKNILIEKGLRWLKENQYISKGGEQTFPLLSGHSIDSILPDSKAPMAAGSWQNSTGVTALALNAILTSGRTISDPVYGDVINSAISFMLTRQITSGFHSGGFHEGTIQNSYGYSTPMAIVALYNACQNANLPSALKSTVTTAYNNGLNYLVQDVNDAWTMVSWRYDRGYTNQSSGDNSVNQWVYLALDKVGYEEKNIWTKIYNYQNAVKCVSGNTARVGYTSCNERPQAMTCAGLWGVHFAAVRDVPGSLELRQQMLNYLEQMGINQLTNPALIGENQIISAGGYHYYLYALTKALNMYEQQTFAGVDWFNTIYEQIKTLKKTSTSGYYYWDDWGGQGAPMETALAILSLQTGTVPPESKINIALNVTNKNDCLLFAVYDENGNAAGKNPNGTWYTNIPNSEWILTGNGYFELEVQLSSAENFSTEITNICSEPVDFQLQFASYIGDDQTDIESYTLIIPDNNTMGATCFVNAIGGLNVIMINPPSVIPGMQLSPPVVAFNPLNPGAVHDFTFTVAETGGESTIKNINLFAGNLNDEFGNVIQASAFNINPVHFDSIQPGQSGTVNVQLTIPGSFSVPPGLFTGLITAQASLGLYKSVNIEVGSPTISVSPAIAEVDYQGDNLQFSISFNGMTGAGWSVNTPDEWMVTDVTGGSGNDTINVTIEANYQNTAREGTLTIQSSDTYNQQVVINITQQPAPEFTVSTSASPSEGGTTSGDGLYLINSQCTVTALSNPGFQFSHWTENEIQLSANASYSFIVEADKNLIAVFIPVEDELILEPGWNLISLAVIPANSSPDSVFAPLIGNNNIETVTGFQNQQGVFFDPTLPSFINSLQEILPGEGYWVKVYDADTLIVQGSNYPSGFSIDLKAGWNLIGYWEENTITPEVAFAPLIQEGILESVTAFENGGLLYEPDLPGFINTLTEVKNGKGYWVKVSEDFENFNFQSSLGNGLLAYYPFNGNANDESGNGNDGTAMGLTSFENGVIGSCAKFRGDQLGDYVSIPSVNLNLTQVSISAWVNVNNIDNGEYMCSESILSFDDADSPNFFALWVQRSGVPGTCAGTTDSLSYRLNWPGLGEFWTNYKYYPGTWTHVVGNFDGVKARIYVNGILEIESDSILNSSINNLAPMWINSHHYWGSSTPGRIGGRIDEVRLYNRSLTEAEIQQLYETEQLFVCGLPFTDPRDGQTYNTVQIGDQCWMAENLNIGTRIDGVNNQSDNGTIEKYCYNNDDANCDVYGGLYQWDEMMHYSTVEGVQGICPAGWHLPSDADWCTLEQQVDPTITCFITGWRGADGGGKLKETGTIHWSSPNTGATNSSGFTALPSGQRSIEVSFDNLGYYGTWWSSSENNASLAWLRYLLNGNAQVRRDYYYKSLGVSVRCIKNDQQSANLPSVNTSPVSEIAQTSALSGGEIISDGGAQVTAHGVCWNTSGNPTLSDSFTTDGAGTGQYTSQLTGLSPGTTYYVKAYATNSVGNAFGEELTFATQAGFTCGAPLTDSRDGKIYATVQIGTQCWMQDNLKTGIMKTLPNYPSDNGIIEKWCLYNDENIGNTWGAFYTWDELMDYETIEGTTGICPAGWHIPTLNEFTQLINFLGGADVAGAAMKVGGSSGFNATMMGMVDFNPGFFGEGAASFYWMSTQQDFSNANNLGIVSGPGAFTQTTPKNFGFLVRCISDESASAVLPTVTTFSVSNITQNTATCDGVVTADGGTPVNARGACWNTTGNPTLADSLTTNGNGIGIFACQLTGLFPGITYYVRAYATNSVGTAYGEELNFTTLGEFTCGSPFTDPRDNQSYNTLQIGSQCWMAENINIGSRIDGVIDQSNNGTIEKYCYNNDEANCEVYGGLYQWDEMMHYTTIEGVQGICPPGWHLPSDAEWTTLTDYLGGLYAAGGAMKETSTTHWASPNTGATNSSGFTALPGGIRSNGNFYYGLSRYGYWRSSTEYSTSDALGRVLDYGNAFVGRFYNSKSPGHSVRCLKDI